jgi:hypothetical protein
MERTPTTTGSSSSAVRRLRMTEAHLRAPLQQQQELEGASAAAEGVGAALRTHWTFAPTFDVREMTRLLDHDNHDMRQRFRAFAKHPLFLVQNNIPLDKEREVALQRTLLGAHTSFPTEQPPIYGYLYIVIILFCYNLFSSGQGEASGE